ncbi:hypothetical protein [Streptomyces sp. Wh19]|uniref:hypothetical protein n=1 Tax=Streptomyces sp. Wh19 TaxID=3076629 RepID=UPI00295894D9|nr:hypothetical protein [Streptomyces sp. Wh19]MDV9194338.1 hypothetical protein [Streptomyces sp. Wh19]
MTTTKEQHMPDQYRTVVAAVDRLTTQVRRVADAMETPVTASVIEDETTPGDAISAVKLGPQVFTCPTGRHVAHGGMDCDEADKWKVAFNQWMSSAATQFAAAATLDGGPHQPPYNAVPAEDGPC